MSVDWSKEEQVAIQAVRAASRVCQAVQKQLVNANTIQKKDKSPVTVADFASQAVVCAKLMEAFPNDPVVGEEDAAELREADQASVLKIVTEHVRSGLGTAATEDQVLTSIDRGGSKGYDPNKTKRFWTLDPIDGTKGFLRAEQYAVALALIEDGRVVLGVLGCPNLPIDGGSGALMVARKGHGARVIALESTDMVGQPIHVTPGTDTSTARFCESVESGHSDQGQSATIVKLLGITAEPVRMDSQAKYATVARGDAQIYLRMPTKADYREKIWDHAAGLLVVEEAGGKVTDITGKPLDFTQGRQLENNKGVVATSGAIHAKVIEAVGKVV